MNICKKSIIVLLCILLTISTLFISVDFSYAEDNDDGWAHTTTKEEISALAKAYYASRNFYQRIDPIKAAVTWQYDTLNDASLYLYNRTIDELVADCKYIYDHDGFLRFLLDDNYIVKMGEIYWYLCEKYGLTDNSTKVLYSGEYFEDNEGNGCMVWILNRDSADVTWNTFKDNVDEFGTIYRYEGLEVFKDVRLQGQHQINYKYENNDYSKTYYLNNILNYYPNFQYNEIWLSNADSGSNSGYSSAIYFQYHSDHSSYGKSKIFNEGYLIITKKGGYYYLGNYLDLYDKNQNTQEKTHKYSVQSIINLSNHVDVDNTSVTAKTGDARNDYESGKNAIIDAGKLPLEEFLSDDEAPVTVTNYDPVDDPVPEPNPPSNGGNGTTINLPIIGGVINADGSFNFSMPDQNTYAPNGFQIPDLIHKFPFCIPLDIYAILDLCDATPSAPRFQGQIDLGIIDYNMDINLNIFDNVMSYFRGLMLVLYALGLGFITKEVLF